jgi:hypothetical protein
VSCLVAVPPRLRRASFAEASVFAKATPDRSAGQVAGLNLSRSCPDGIAISR